ncbi:MAG: cob(I)yrinic acid a,c-diamide adenosyltransferase [Anaerolineae bacterium]|nr:cob(I)yrinic acid a,c-diamide adenosyltransferase [Anaerolineae bacterium]
MKLYTRTGDGGTTALLAGGRVPKDHPRVAAYGALDELNAMIGLARALGVDAEIDARLDRIQHELFDLGSDMATPPDRSPAGLTRVSPDLVERLESEIDAMDAALDPLREFILPGGAPGGAALHAARTVCRRAERAIVSLMAVDAINEVGLQYVNRLSDWLFAAARLANLRAGAPEVRWRSYRG